MLTDPNHLTHGDYMDMALEEAQKAADCGDVPVGCVIVQNGEVIARGHNTRESDNSAVAHAEINAIKEACDKLNSWRLLKCKLYVTLEPCMMCMGAIMNARIDLVVFGACDDKNGSCGEMPQNNMRINNHSVEILAGIRERACYGLLKNFFSGLR